MEQYDEKYIKYKLKYIDLKQKQIGGENEFVNNSVQNFTNLVPSFDSGNGDEKVKRHLALCEKLNFEGANKQNWNLIRKIYDENVAIIMSNGTTIKGIDKHIEEMKKMYELAPDTKVISHGIQFGSGDWTAVTQNMKGTFTGPMKDFNGKGTIIQPNGNKFTMQACSIIRWKNDKIIEERIFWDEKDFDKQLGIKNA